MEHVYKISLLTHQLYRYASLNDGDTFREIRRYANVIDCTYTNLFWGKLRTARFPRPNEFTLSPECHLLTSFLNTPRYKWINSPPPHTTYIYVSLNDGDTFWEMRR